MAACRTGGYGPILATALLTAFAWTPKTPSGTAMSPTSVACVFAKVARYCRRSTWIVVASLAHSEALTRGRCSWWQPSGRVLRAWQAEHERVRCSSLRCECDQLWLTLLYISRVGLRVMRQRA